jgi:hypothetical protein
MLRADDPQPSAYGFFGEDRGDSNSGGELRVDTRGVTPNSNPSNVKMANAWATASAHWGGGTTNIRRQPERPSAKASSPSVALPPT